MAPSAVQVTGGVLYPVIAGNLNVLNDKLIRLTGLFSDDADLSTPGSRSIGELAAIIRRTGISYEWMLLAWYRSGRDPMRIKELFSSNLKGILANFLNEAGENAPKKN